jgi:chaperonin GroEL
MIISRFSASVAAMVLTTEAVVVADKPEPAGTGGMPDMSGMGGMM